MKKAIIVFLLFCVTIHVNSQSRTDSSVLTEYATLTIVRKPVSSYKDLVYFVYVDAELVLEIDSGGVYKLQIPVGDTVFFINGYSDYFLLPVNRLWVQLLSAEKHGEYYLAIVEQTVGNHIRVELMDKDKLQQIVGSDYQL